MLFNSLNSKKAFIFSLDAFIASLIIFFTLQYIIFLSHSPYSYFNSFRQIHYLASDTLNALSSLEYENKTENVLSQAILYAYGQAGPPIKLIYFSNLVIPPSYSYAYDFYDLSSGSWVPIFNATSIPSRNFSIYKIMASSYVLTTVYINPQIIGDSPYCNVECKGFDIASNSYVKKDKCDMVPCNFKPGTTFDPGAIKIGLVRLTVWG